MSAAVSQPLRKRAASLGYVHPLGSALAPTMWRACKDHERVHHLLAEARGHPVSLALWHAAHPDQQMRAADRVLAHIEERTVLLIQRIANEGIDAVWGEREAAQTERAA